jgi:hypothetical protein
MYRTLEDLQHCINLLIANHGKNAPCAAWVFTQEDVYDVDDAGELVLRPVEVADKVLETVGDTHYIYEVIADKIREELRELSL